MARSSPASSSVGCRSTTVLIQCRPDRGINQIAAIDRHTGKGTTRSRIRRRFWPETGAWRRPTIRTTSILLVVGANAEDMAAAVAECARQGGGFVVANQGQVVATRADAALRICSQKNRSISSLKTSAGHRGAARALAAAFNRLSTRSPLPVCRCPSEGSRFPPSASSMSGSGEVVPLVSRTRARQPVDRNPRRSTSVASAFSATVRSDERRLALCRRCLFPGGAHEPLPILIQRTPYNKLFAQTGVYQHPAWYARHGYVVVVQDTRGRFASGGDFEPYAHEAEDGADTIGWAAALPNSTAAGSAPSASRMPA